MEISRRHALFSFSMSLWVLIFYSPLTQLVTFSAHDEISSYILLIPFISGVFFYWKRRRIFKYCDFALVKGAVLIGTGGLIFITGLLLNEKFEGGTLPLLIFSSWLVWVGIFVLFYGLQSFKRALFPILFLLFMIPIPSYALDAFELFLQKGSAETVNVIFTLLGLPVIREGYAFHFPNLSVEIWESCAGVRVAIVLVISSVMAANLFLEQRWAIAVAVLASVPIAILRNALRIVSLSLIGSYFDEGIFKSGLHSIKGGIFFFGFALVLLWAVITLLKRAEEKTCLEKVQQK